MKTTVTNRELVLFAINAQKYASNHPGTRFSKVLDQVRKANQDLIDQYYVDSEEINIDLASVDEKQNLIYQDLQNGIFAYTKENKKLLGKKISELNKKAIEVTYKHVALADVPKGLPDDFRAVFTPFVLAPVVEEEDTEG